MKKMSLVGVLCAVVGCVTSDVDVAPSAAPAHQSSRVDIQDGRESTEVFGCSEDADGFACVHDDLAVEAWCAHDSDRCGTGDSFGIGTGRGATESKQEFDCVEDIENGFICTSEEMDVVVWCDYDSGECGAACIYCG